MHGLNSKLKHFYKRIGFFILNRTNRLWTDKAYLKFKFRLVMDRKLNLKNPTMYNDKLQWLKLYDRNPLYTTMVDKYAIKGYVANIIGEEYIIPTLGVWDKFDDIDFDSLPDQFVLKCTHDSGGLVICKDKKNLDLKKAKEKIEKSLRTDYYLYAREWPYKNVPRKIIAEKFIKDSASEDGDLRDYKFMCFNGEVKCSFVCSERKKGLRVTFFDKEWKRMPFDRHYPQSDKLIPQPLKYEEMVHLSEILSKDISFVRVDFYEVDGQIYFGEMTFFPGAGFEEFNPEEWDSILGSWINIDNRS